MKSPLVENQAWKISALKNDSVKSWSNLEKAVGRKRACSRHSHTGWADLVERISCFEQICFYIIKHNLFLFCREFHQSFNC